MLSSSLHACFVALLSSFHRFNSEVYSPRGLPITIQCMANDLERREPLSGLRSVVHPTGEVTGVTTLPATKLHWVLILMGFGEGVRGGMLGHPRVNP